MKKSISLFIFVMVCGLGHVMAQRTVDRVLRLSVPAPLAAVSNATGAAVGDEVFLACSEAFYKYNGETSTRFDYPVRDGVPLTISRTFGGTNIDTWTLDDKKTLPVLNSVVYLTLTSQPTDECPFENCGRYLYQYVDGVIVPSPIPDETVSNVVIFQRKAYIVIRTDDGARLLSLDGSTVSTVFSSLEYAGEDANAITLFATDQYLYIAQHHFNGPSHSRTDVNVIRFDGSDFIDIPQFDLAGSWVREVHQRPGTETVYFHSEADITVFDGSTVTEIVEESSVDYFGFADFENVVYFIRADLDFSGVTLRYYDGVSLGVVTLPDGAQILGIPNALLVYDGELLLSARMPSGGRVIYRYDGTSFFPFLTSAPGESFGSLLAREDKLFIQAFPLCYEYYRRSYCTIDHDGYTFLPNLSTTDFHVWRKRTLPIGPDDNGFLEFGAERNIGCGGDDDIPDPGYERIDVSLLGAGIDDYCGLGVRWPPPRPPFPDRWWQVSLTDTKGTTVFQEKFNKPSEFSLPLSVKQSYDFSLDVLNETTQSFESVITIDKELVPLGLSDLSLSMEPKNGKVFLKALTNNGKEVPFQMTLFNQKGIAIWQEVFTAPLSKEITDGVEVGASLRLSAIPMPPMEVKLNYYPNPFAGKITVEFDAEKETPVYLAIYSLQGELVQQKTLLQAPGKHTIELGSKNKEGLYILSITSGSKELRELIELKYK